LPTQAWGVATTPDGGDGLLAGVSRLASEVSEDSKGNEDSSDFAGVEASCEFPGFMIALLMRAAGSTERIEESALEAAGALAEDVRPHSCHGALAWRSRSGFIRLSNEAAALLYREID
jgi:hypothetical protein